MKLTANELRHRCIDGEKWRRECWPEGLYYHFDKSQGFGFGSRAKNYPHGDVMNASEFDDWEQVIEKKPFPFKEGEPVWFDKTKQRIEKGFYKGISHDNNYFHVIYGDSIIICKELFKYELSFNHNAESVNAEDLGKYEVE